MEWYVIQAYSGYEQKVKVALEERIALNNLSEKFGEILIPTEQIVELKGGAKKTTERKFFPGYILVQMNLEDDSWQLVQSTPRVSGFVGGTREKPLPISEEDVNNIMDVRVISINDIQPSRDLVGIDRGHYCMYMMRMEGLDTIRLV